MALPEGYGSEDICPLIKAAGMPRIILAALVVGTAVAVAAALLAEPVDIVTYVFIILVLVPAALAFGVIGSYDRDVNSRAPELFYDLSEYISAGGSFSRAVRRASEGSYGVMSDEMCRVRSDIEDEGLDIAAALKGMAGRVNNAYVSRSVAVICEALTSSPDVEGILKMAAAEGRLSLSLFKERRSGILPAVAVMYLTTIILLMVVSLCVTSLVPMSQELKRLTGGEGMVTEGPREYALPYFFLSVAVAICSGLTIGVMRDCSAYGGLKDAALLVTLVFVVFEMVVFPGFNLMGVLAP